MPGRVYAQYTEYFNSFTQFLYLLFLLTRLRPVILQSSRGTPTGPAVLPPSVSSYLAEVLSLHPDVVAALWTALRPFFPDLEEHNYTVGVDDLFRQHGRNYELGKSFNHVLPSFVSLLKPNVGGENLYPPTDRCLRTECPRFDGGSLSMDISVDCRLFTLHRGVLNVRSHSTYCAGQ